MGGCALKRPKGEEGKTKRARESVRKKGCDLYAELLMPRLLLVRPLSIYFRSSVPRQGTLLHVSAILLVFLLARFRFVPLLLLRRPYGVSLSMSSSTNPHCSPIIIHSHRRIERSASDESIRVIPSPSCSPLQTPRSDFYHILLFISSLPS